MRPVITLLMILFIASCTMPADTTYQPQPEYEGERITHSLFNDKSSTISEENIKKILDGTYSLPQKMKAAIVRLEGGKSRAYNRYITDEEYLKTQQLYVDTLIGELKETGRVKEAVMMPELLISSSPSFTTLREAAVRMQADIVVVYSVNTDVYYKYKVFAKSDIKAFATTQLMVMDVRTGLIPFSTIVTRDTLSNKQQNETDMEEARHRIENAAGMLTILEVGERLNAYLRK